MITHKTVHVDRAVVADESNITNSKSEQTRKRRLGTVL